MCILVSVILSKGLRLVYFGYCDFILIRRLVYSQALEVWPLNTP